MRFARAIRARLQAMDPRRVDALLAGAFLVEARARGAAPLPGRALRGRRRRLHRRAGRGAAAAPPQPAGVARCWPGARSWPSSRSGARSTTTSTAASSSSILLLFSFGLHETGRAGSRPGWASPTPPSVAGSLLDAYPDHGPRRDSGLARVRRRPDPARARDQQPLAAQRGAAREGGAAPARPRRAGRAGRGGRAHPHRRRAARRGRARAERDGRAGRRPPGGSPGATPTRARERVRGRRGHGPRGARRSCAACSACCAARTRSSALAPQPSLRHLAALVRAHADRRPAGSSCRVDGEARPLPAGVDLTAYRRACRRRSGGALEHGAAGRAQVTVRYSPTRSSSRCSTTAPPARDRRRARRARACAPLRRADAGRPAAPRRARGRAPGCPWAVRRDRAVAPAADADPARSRPRGRRGAVRGGRARGAHGRASRRARPAPARRRRRLAARWRGAGRTRSRSPPWRSAPWCSRARCWPTRPTTSSPFVALMLFRYGAGAYADGRSALAALAIMLAGIATVVRARARTAVVGDVVFPTAFGSLAWLVGRAVRTRTAADGGAARGRGCATRGGPRGRGGCAPWPRSAGGSRARCTTSSPTASA